MRRASSRVKVLIDDQRGGDHTHCILLRRWYESRRLVTRVTFLALAALHSWTRSPPFPNTDQMTGVSVCHDDSKIGRHSVDRQRIGRLRRSFARTWHRSSGRSARCSAGSAVRIGYIRCGRPSTPGSSSKYRLNGGLENKNDAGCGSRPASLPPCAAVGSHRWLTTVSGLPTIVLSAQHLRQLGDVGGDAPRLVAGQ
jgi:hypothetical protein